MGEHLLDELERLTRNAALHRQDLLLSGRQKSRRRKALNIAAGVLSLLSAGTIMAVTASLFGSKGVQLLAALGAGMSGTISLFITAYFSDGEVLSMLNGSSKYLAPRESVYSLVINPRISNEERFDVLTELQREYARLDEAYSRYFSLFRRGRLSSQRLVRSDPPPLWKRRGSVLAWDAAEDDVLELHKRMGIGPD